MLQGADPGCSSNAANGSPAAGSDKLLETCSALTCSNRSVVSKNSSVFGFPNLCLGPMQEHGRQAEEGSRSLLERERAKTSGRSIQNGMFTRKAGLVEEEDHALGIADRALARKSPKLRFIGSLFIRFSFALSTFLKPMSSRLKFFVPQWIINTK